MSALQVFYKLSDIDIEKWKSFCDNHKYATVFQSISIHNFWNSQKNNESFIFFVESPKGECLGFCTGTIIAEGKGLIKYFSRRAVIYGGPLIEDNEYSNEVASLLINKIENFLRPKVIYIEFRNFYRENYLDDVFNTKSWNYIPYMNYIINLTTKEDVFKNFNSERRRQIRKGLREGVLVSSEKSEENIKAVYEVLSYMYATRIKKPVPSLSYFSEMMKLEESGVVSVSYNDKVIGGSFFLKDKHTIYDWYRGGLDVENPKKYPSAITDWSIMSYGMEHEIKKFDFMGAGVRGKEYGVRVYKSRFGGELVEYGRYLLITKPGIYKVSKSFMKKANSIICKLKKIKIA